MLFRVFPLLSTAAPRVEGGALHVPRERQGTGRHDDPERYGALYAARTPESAVAEHIQSFRGQEITDGDLKRRDGRPYALATIDDRRLADLPDLDDPRELLGRGLRPSRVASGDRSTTQPIARGLFEEGAVGFAWWSTLEASWVNVTLFAERALRWLAIAAEPQPLTIELPLLRRTAERLGIRLRRTRSSPRPS